MSRQVLSKKHENGDNLKATKKYHDSYLGAYLTRNNLDESQNENELKPIEQYLDKRKTLFEGPVLKLNNSSFEDSLVQKYRLNLMNRYKNDRKRDNLRLFKPYSDILGNSNSYINMLNSILNDDFSHSDRTKTSKYNDNGSSGFNLLKPDYSRVLSDFLATEDWLLEDSIWFGVSRRSSFNDDDDDDLFLRKLEYSSFRSHHRYKPMPIENKNVQTLAQNDAVKSIKAVEMLKKKPEPQEKNKPVATRAEKERNFQKPTLSMIQKQAHFKKEDNQKKPKRAKTVTFKKQDERIKTARNKTDLK